MKVNSEQKFNSFTEAMSTYIHQQTGTIATSPAHCFALLNKLQEGKSTRHPMWNEMSQLSGITTKQCHDYFHNTWSQKFYDPILPHRPELRQIVDTLVPIMPTEGINEAVLNEFLNRHTSGNFYRRGLFQAISVMTKRARNTQDKSSIKDSISSETVALKNEEGFSADVSDCLLLNELFGF